ncbi:hypothetical protein HDU97_005112 [Phlyctochytrium planicorne]|nr:hypothetical protein HDU97_005112 [Phlyctochytrium planicorne]
MPAFAITSLHKVLAILALFAVVAINTVSAETCSTYTFGNRSQPLYTRIRTCVGNKEYVNVFFDNSLYWQPTPNTKGVVVYTLPAAKVSPTRVTFDKNAYVGVTRVKYDLDTSSIPKKGWKTGDIIRTLVSSAFRGCSIDADLEIRVENTEIAC